MLPTRTHAAGRSRDVRSNWPSMAFLAGRGHDPGWARRPSRHHCPCPFPLACSATAHKVSVPAASRGCATNCLSENAQPEGDAGGVEAGARATQASHPAETAVAIIRAVASAPDAAVHAMRAVSCWLQRPALRPVALQTTGSRGVARSSSGTPAAAPARTCSEWKLAGSSAAAPGPQSAPSAAAPEPPAAQLPGCR